jgi:hypothetical protein
MRTIHKYVYAAVLILSAFTVQRSLAAAEARGYFTLSHEVHLQKSVLPAREYSFSVRASGPSEILLLQGTRKTSLSTMVLVKRRGELNAPDDSKRLILVSRNGNSM